jgi:hypothetical protein
MDRRDLLKVGAAASLGIIEACAPQRPPLEPGELPPDMDEFLRGLDQRMEDMTHAEFVKGFAEAATDRKLLDSERAQLQSKEELFRKMLRTLYVTQTFRDLPETAQRHPGMQERMMRHLDEIDQTVTDVTGMLENLDDDQRTKLRNVLRDRPDLPMTIAEKVDEHAAKAGVSGKRRLQLRAMMLQTSFRMKHAAPGAVIDEYVHKVRRFTAQNGMQTDVAMRLAGRATSDAFWQQQAAAPPAASSPAPGTGTVKTGAILMGVGVVTFGVSVALVGTWTGFLVGATIGAVLFAVGLIVLIVGAIIYAASSPQPAAPAADPE